jgi:lipopolysaccharide/colanic/teichoic acid biosynthesis glycosyltransferase
MTFGGRKATTLLFAGDLVVFILSLWLTFLVRYLAVPHFSDFAYQIDLYSPIFAIWILVFYMAGLYSKRVILFKNELWGAILRTQLLNIVLGALYFFLIPALGIAPKTILAIYLLISLGGIFLWRIVLFPRFTRPNVRDRAVLIGEGDELEELMREVNSNARYQVEFIARFTPQELMENFEECAKELLQDDISMLVVDTQHDAMRPLLAQIYELAFVSPKYSFVDFYEMYEEVFDRVPLSLLQYDWFLKNVSTAASNFYEVGKRVIDIFGGLAMFVVMIIAMPFIFIALRLEGSGPLFITQDRFGMNGSRVKTYKFRSMRYSDQGVWLNERTMDKDKGIKDIDKGHQENYVTRVGSFLRITSLDEFPQCINILRGELSLIGPRNDVAALGAHLSEAIPYYSIRYIVKPGITGWAQINQQYEQGNISPKSVPETKMRLAYDFYYIKNRSFALDIVIALKTVKRMLFRVSSL